MTGKKKLNLGPLPEELDYSKYEETVTRWDRIIGVILAGLILLGLLVYLFLPSSEPASNIAQPEQAPLVIPQVASTETVQDVSENTITEEPETGEPETEVPETQTLASEVVAQAEEAASPNAPVNEKDQESELSAAIQPKEALEAPQVKPVDAAERGVAASVRIVNPAITQAILTDELVDSGPGAPLAEAIVLPESGITKVMLFTDMQGLSGRTLYHEWYRNGERQARVKIPVNFKEQRSYSSKFINLQMTGDWQVKIVDSKGAAFLEAGFKVIKP